MKILITGASGFVGLNIVEALLTAGHHVKAYLRTSARKRYLSAFPVEIAEGSLTDSAALRSAMEGTDAVIHTAGNTSTRWSDLPELEATNIEGTRAVLEAMKATGIMRLVYTGTTATLDSHHLGQTGSHGPVRGFRADSPYAKTKACAEALLMKSSEAIILSPAEVIGPYDHTLQWGRMILAVALGKVPFIPPGGGTFCPSRAVADAHVAALTTGKPGHRYVLGGHNLLFSDFISQIHQITGGSIQPQSRLPYSLQTLLARIQEHIPGSKGPQVESFRMRVFGGHHYFDDSPARTDLGYNPGPIKDAITEGYKWYLDNNFIRSN